MSSIHLTKRDMERYLDHELTMAELYSFNDHLMDCESCYQRLDAEGELESAYDFVRSELARATGEASDHLSQHQLASFVDGECDGADREILETHIETCPKCDAELADFVMLKAVVRIAGPVSPKRRGAWRRFWTPSVAAAIAATAILSAVGWMVLSLRSQIAALAGDVAEVRRSNEAMHEEIAAVASLKERLAEIEERRDEPTPAATGVTEPSRVAVTLMDGGRRIELEPDGTLAGLTPGRYAGLVKTALLTGRLPAPRLFRAGIVGSVRSGFADEPFTPLAPVAAMILADRPVFRWTKLDGAERYIVFVRDTESGKQIESSPMAATEWVPDRSLQHGRTYSWTIEALKDGQRVYVPGVGRSRLLFRIAEKGTKEELDRARAESKGSHLVMCVLFAQKGLMREAEEELKAIQAENHGSEIVRRLVRSLSQRQ